MRASVADTVVMARFVLALVRESVPCPCCSALLPGLSPAGLKLCCFALRRPRSNEPSAQPDQPAPEGARQWASGCGGGIGHFGGSLRPAAGGGPPGGQLEGVLEHGVERLSGIGAADGDAELSRPSPPAPRRIRPAGGPASRGHKRPVSLMPADGHRPSRCHTPSTGGARSAATAQCCWPQWPLADSAATGAARGGCADGRGRSRRSPPFGHFRTNG